MARLARLIFLASCCLVLDGCYYAQAVRGHMDLMSRRQDLAGVIDSPDASAELRNKLKLVQEARLFAVDQLLLPDNESYRSYADLERDYVVWNVFAAAEFELAAKSWCFPVAGCVAYRGYFNEEKARAKADRLRADGFDVAVGGVTAYSTLGRFADPVLNTMLAGSKGKLVGTLFHELAHQRLYLKGDTGFNESFASAVEELGIVAWFKSQDDTASICSFQQQHQLRDNLQVVIDEYRKKLDALYAQPLSQERKREAKKQVFGDLSVALDELFAVRPTPAWFMEPMNNAKLVPLALYRDKLPAFREVFYQCDESFGCFYSKAGEIADMPAEKRGPELKKLAVLNDQRVSVNYCSAHSDPF